MFLPDHRIKKHAKKTKTHGQPEHGHYLPYLQEQLSVLFDTPENLFDPFASPALFFHNPGLLVPRSFTTSIQDAVMIDALASSSAIAPDALSKSPRKSHSVFPPRYSTLRIPETLLMFDGAAAPINKKRRIRGNRHSLEAQAYEMAELMKRSVAKHGFREEGQWGEDIYALDDEPARRVQLKQVGEERGGLDLQLSDYGRDSVLQWLEQRTQDGNNQGT